MIHTLKQFWKQLTKGRSSKWPKVRSAHLRIYPSCAACGTTKHLEVHHLIPVHVMPAQELEPLNLITLCEYHGCHFRVGHAFNWKAYNPHCREDAQQQLVRIRDRLAA